MGQFIRQLTGVRFLAAAWVMLYHYQPALATAGILIPIVHEILRVGSLGVDLFFALSGFILTHTYLTKLGPAIKAKKVSHFLWLRLARIYPVHFVMLNVAGIAVLAQGLTGAPNARDRDWLNPWDYLKQLLLVQEWGPDPARGWNFVAWSLSLEWLAYLLFPLIALVLFRVRDRLPTPTLAVATFGCLMPLLWIGFARTSNIANDPYLVGGWGSTYRILCEFTAGGFLYLVVRRLAGSHGPSVRVRAVALWLAWLIPVAIVATSVGLGNIPSLQWPGLANEAPKFYIVLVPMLVAWIGALALTARGPSRFFSHRRMILGGFISYSLYMIHEVWYGLWKAGMSAAGIDGGVAYLVGVVGLIAMTIVFAYLMWRIVEEPSREWMRARIGVRRKPVEEEATEVSHSASG